MDKEEASQTNANTINLEPVKAKPSCRTVFVSPFFGSIISRLTLFGRTHSLTQFGVGGRVLFITHAHIYLMVININVVVVVVVMKHSSKLMHTHTHTLA